MMLDENPETSWSVAIFACRENIDTLTRTFVHLAAALEKTTASVVDVLVNGNVALARQVTALLQNNEVALPASCEFRAWSSTVGDKALAWNEYVHNILPDADVNFFIDGYSWVDDNSLGQLAAALADSNPPLAATGLPTSGRSSAMLHKSAVENNFCGGLHGNLYAITRSTAGRLRSLNVRLPGGTYWSDGLLGQILIRNMDPIKFNANNQRTVIVPDANWCFEEHRLTRMSDVSAHARRRFRQARGRLENAALKNFIEVDKRSFSQLPPSNRILIRDWAKSNPVSAIRTLARDPLGVFTLIHFCLSGGPIPSADKRSFRSLYP